MANKKKALPKLGIVYVLRESERTYWLAVDFETYERSGTYRHTRTLQVLIQDEVQRYLEHGLILYDDRKIQ